MHVCNYFTITNMNHVVTVPPKKYVCVSSLVYKWQMIVEAFNYRRHGTIFCFLHSLLTGTGNDKLSPIENPYVSFPWNIFVFIPYSFFNENNFQECECMGCFWILLPKQVFSVFRKMKTETKIRNWPKFVSSNSFFSLHWPAWVQSFSNPTRLLAEAVFKTLNVPF